MIEEQIRRVAGRCKSTLEMTIRERTMFVPMVMAFRGTDEIALIIPGEDAIGGGDTNLRDAALDTARKAAHAFSADFIAMVNDAWYQMGHERNPLTGRDWANGDMQDLADNHHGIERGWVSEALTISMANRADDLVVMTCPYVRQHGRRVTWLEDQMVTDGGDVSGYMPRAIRQLMADPTLDQVLQADVTRGRAPDLTAEYLSQPAARDKMDLIAAELLVKDHCLVRLAAELGTPRAKLFAEAGGTYIQTIQPWSDN